MADRPIIFSAPMVRALLDGRKTQTRRLLKPEPELFPIDDAGTPCNVSAIQIKGDGHHRIALGSDKAGVITTQRVNFGIGDRLYVREACAIDGQRAFYRAGHEEARAQGPRVDVRWRPSIHMPRWASRLTLIVESVRVERLQDISEVDALAEGIIEYEPTDEDPPEFSYVDGGDIWNNARSAFRGLWQSLHGAESWDVNPWVVALTFSVTPHNIDRIAA